MADAEALLRKIQALPPESVAEVEDFIEFISAKARRRAAMDRLLRLAPALEGAGAPPISDAEIETEIEAVRAARRAREVCAGGSLVDSGNEEVRVASTKHIDAERCNAI